VIFTRTHASLVEVSVRSGRPQAWWEDRAVQGKIAATLTADGWLVSRADAERLVVEWGVR
jgi:hypothetical protein